MEQVIINGSKWSKSNLKASFFRNGEPLLYAHDLNEWNYACENEQPAYCISEMESEVDGYLYNVFAVKDSRGLFDDTKWMIPRQKDWEELIEFCGGLDVSGYYLKSKSGWSSGYDFNSKITCRECKEWNDEYRSKVPCHNCLDKRLEIINHNGNGIDTFGFDAKPTGQRVGGVECIKT